MDNMDIDSSFDTNTLKPPDQILRRLALIGVPEEVSDQPSLVAFVKDDKSRMLELVSAILPTDEEVWGALQDAKSGSRRSAISMKRRFRESMLWLQWLMFEGEPASALKNLSRMSSGQRGVCGAVWGNNDVAYRCRTCEHDPTCAICVPCFQNGDHTGHDYSIIYTGGGCCDCGDVTAWKREGFCSKHKGAEQIQPLPEEVANSVRPVLNALFICWKKKLLVAETIPQENPRAGDHISEQMRVASELTFVVVEMLLEFCKYSESLLSFVSRMVCSSLGLLQILVRAERFLKDDIVKKLYDLLLRLLGDPFFKYEFAKVFLSYYPTVVNEAIKMGNDNGSTNYSLQSTFSVQIFTVPTLTPRLVKEMNLLVMLLGCLGDIFAACAGEDGRLQIAKWANLYDTTIRVVEDIRFVMSHAVVSKYVTHDQKDISRTWMRLLAFVQGMNPQKRETGLHIEEDNENMLLPFALCHAIANIHSIFVDGAFSVSSSKEMDEIFSSTCNQDMGDGDSLRHAKVGHLSQESSACSALARTSKLAEIKSDTDFCLLIPPPVKWLINECLKAIENWLGVDNTSGAALNLFSPNTSSNPGSNFSAFKETLTKIKKGKYIFGRPASSSEDHGRQYSSHVHCGDMDFDSENGKRDTVACNSSRSNDILMEVDTMDIDVLRVLSSSDWPNIIYDVSSQEISVHIPLHRLLSLLLQKALRRCFGESAVTNVTIGSSANLLSTSCVDFFAHVLGGCHPFGFSAFVMEHPLRVRVFCAEVHAGMWRKNGDAALLSWEWYRSVRWSEQGLELDLFLLQCCAALAPPDLFVNRILERFGLSKYLSLNLERSNEYEPVLVQEMLTLVIQIVKERRFSGLTTAESLKRELICKLAIGDATRSQLVKSLPHDLSKFNQLQEILDTIATYSSPSGFNQGMYSLRWTYWKELDLYHPRWNSRDLQGAEERYFRFYSVSAFTSQLPRWANIYPPLKEVAKVATCKVVLEIIRAVLFYAVFTDKCAESRAPDGVLLTALHLLSLALDICYQQRESSDQSCSTGDLVPILAYAGEALAGVSLSHAPILFFVCFHKALRAELSQLRRLAVAESESESESSHRCDVVVELRRRFEFLKLVCKYHSAAEDEIIFLALDVHVKNVACTYSLEHESVDGLFDSIFHCLDLLLEDNNNISNQFQELVCCICTIQTSTCQHMLKEEEQVFPLLMQQFSSKEQGSLVWQFICSVPLMLIEEFLPWMISFLSPEEQEEVTLCIKDIVPREKSLQEVVISWLGNNNQPSSKAYTRIGEGAQCPDAFKILLGENWNWIKACIQTDVGHNPIDCLNLWHGAIGKDLKEILEELYQIRSSSSFSNLDSIVIRLTFLVDVLSFYSNAQKKFFYPMLNQLANGCLSPSDEQFPSGSYIEGLQLLLHHNVQNGIPLCKFLDKLCRELESFMLGVSKQFAFQETKVFPIIRKNCSHEMQQRLLYMSLIMMPLGLLKCMITWFSAHLSEDESRSTLHKIKQGYSFVNKSYESVLCKWFQIGYSGKTSAEKLQEDFQNIFKSRCSFLAEKIKEASGSSSLHSNKQLPEGSSSRPTELNSANKDRNFSISSSSSHTTEQYEISYSSGINIHIFFPGGIAMVHPFPKFPGDKSCSSSFIDEPKPTDFIFFFHKALKKDLEYLVFGSAQLTENVGLLVDFRQRFHLIRSLFQIHSDAEDKVAFPALEVMGKVQNISHSYTIDHKLEIEHFSRISLILDKMYELHFSISSVDSKIQEQEMVKHHKLCRKLYDTCRSVHKLIANHIHREEVELWSLFRESLTFEEQEKIIGRMLGRIRAEILQDVIPWLMESLTAEEQHAMMYLWRKATKNTMFDEWLGEWWEGCDKTKMSEESNISPLSTADRIEIISAYLSKEVLAEEKGRTVPEKVSDFPQKDHADANVEPLRNFNEDDKEKVLNRDKNKCSKCTGLFRDKDKKKCNEVEGVIDQIDKSGQLFQVPKNSAHCERLLTMSQEDLDAAIRKVYRDSSLDSQKKSYIIQFLQMSRWILKQQISHTVSSDGKDIPGQNPSYVDPLKLTFGCKHYKRNCKLFASCCNKLYTCRRCHDEVADHSMDRKSITKMMCMKCLQIQPIGLTCSTVSCNNFSMARYYCKICKIFEDQREIYHCPYCNLCRIGKGLGIDYFHCMNCNACMSRSLSVHICREKCFMDNCPICHEYIFTSSSPIKALPCGHLMHSTCFKDYTYSHYTCPICSKSLGDMQVYFNMLDAFLAEEQIPDEYAGKTQVILCNDCEKRGEATFHWLYHKCSYCGSYNTRLL